MRVKLSILLFDIRTPDDLKILALPVNLKMSGYSIHEAFVAFEDLERAGNAPHGEECIKCSSERGVRVSQTFPIGETSCTRNTQGIVRRAADRKSIGRFLLTKTKCLCYSCCDCICSLGRVIEAFGTYWRNVREPALNLVGYSEGCEEIFATFPGILTRSKHRSQIITGMAGLMSCNVAVVKV